MNGNKFDFKYSAPTEEERKEIDSIRRQYSPREQTETKIERLRRLDALVKNTAIIWSLVLGVLGILILGFGMSLAMSELSEILGAYKDKALLIGAIIGIIGLIPTCLAYPIYLITLKKGKKRYGDEILKLSEELLNENNKNK